MASYDDMYWKGVTKDRYDKVLKILPWEVDLPKGAQFHVAAFTDDGMHVTDIWDSLEDSANLQRHRLMAAIDEVGQADVVIAPGHKRLTPRFHAKEVVHKIAPSAPRPSNQRGVIDVNERAGHILLHLEGRSCTMP